MQTKKNRATNNRPEGTRSLDAPILPINIQKFTKQLLSEKAWRKNDRNAITLFKTPQIRLLLIGLHADTELHTATPKSTLIFQVLRGKLLIRTDQGKEKLRKGQILAMHENIDYSVRSLGRTLFLLTVVE